MHDMSRLSENYSHIGIMVNGDNLLLGWKMDMGHGATIRSRMVFEFDPDPYRDGNIHPMFSSFTVNMRTEASLGDPFFVVDLRSGKEVTDYTMDDVWKIIAKDHIFVENLYFFNVDAVNKGSFKRDIYDVLAIPVTIHGIMTLQVDAGAITYSYDESEQSAYNRLSDEVYNHMTSLIDDDTYDELIKHCNDQAYILDSRKNVIVNKNDFIY